MRETAREMLEIKGGYGGEGGGNANSVGGRGVGEPVPMLDEHTLCKGEVDDRCRCVHRGQHSSFCLIQIQRPWRESKTPTT